MVVVELLCKSEGVVVAEIATDGPLDAKTILKGMSQKDEARVPTAQVIQDFVQMTCGHCHGALFFRDGEGQEFAAMPGSVRTT